jgi:heat shock 70kDa protein 1/2/6/8
VIVIDFGGSTLEVSLLTIFDGAIEIIATSGDHNFGGEDFDQRFCDHFIEKFLKNSGKDIQSNALAMHTLRKEVEKAKRALSN